MDACNAVVQEPTTAEWVLAVLQERQRRLACVDEAAEHCGQLCFETTVADWRHACNLVDWRHLGQSLNEEWRIEAPLAEWRTALEPAEVRCVGDVCDLIARHKCLPRRRAEVAAPEPSGLNSGYASNSSLNDSWSNVGAVFPTRPMAPYCLSSAEAIAESISKPNPVEVRTNGQRKAGEVVLWGVVGGLLLLLVGVVAARFANPWIAIGGAGIFVGCYLVNAAAAWCMTPEGGMRDEG